MIPTSDVFTKEAEIIRQAPLESARFHAIYHELATAQDERFFDRDRTSRAATILDVFENQWAASGSNVERKTQCVFTLFSKLIEDPRLLKLIHERRIVDVLSAGGGSMNDRLDFALTDRKGWTLFLRCLSLSYFKMAYSFLKAEMEPCVALNDSARLEKYLALKRTAYGPMNYLSNLLLLSEHLFRNIVTLAPESAEFSEMRAQLKAMRGDFKRALLLEPDVIKETGYIHAILNNAHLRTHCVFFFLYSTMRDKIMQHKFSCATPSSEALQLLALFGKNSVGEFTVNEEVATQLDQVNNIALLIDIRTMFLSENWDAFRSLVGLLSADYDGPIFIALKSFLLELINKGDIATIYRFQDVLDSFDSESPTEDDDNDDSPFFSDLFYTLLTRVDEASNDNLLIYILKKYKSIVLKPTPAFNPHTYAGFCGEMINSIYYYSDQENIIHYLAEIQGFNAASKRILDEPLIGDAIYLWQSLVVTNTLNVSLFLKHTPAVFKTKMQEYFTQLIKDTEAVKLFAEGFHYLYLLVTRYNLKHPQFEMIRVNLHLILDVLREGDRQFSPLIEELMYQDAGFSEHSVAEIKDLVQPERWLAKQAQMACSIEEHVPAGEPQEGRRRRKKHCGGRKDALVAGVGAVDAMSLSDATLTFPATVALPEVPFTHSEPIPPLHSSATSLALYQGTIDRLRRHQSQLLEHLKAFKLALEGDALEMKIPHPGLEKPWNSLSILVGQCEQIVTGLRKYLKKSRSGNDVLFDLNELDKRSIRLPAWSAPSLDRCRDEIEHLTQLLQSMVSDSSYAAFQFVSHIPALINVISSINIAGMGVGAGLSELEQFSLMLREPPCALGLDAEKTPLPPECMSIAVVPPLFHSLAKSRQRMEATMLSLNHLFVKLFLLKERGSSSDELSHIIQETQDLWQLMQEVRQWSIRLSLDPLGVDLFEDVPLVKPMQLEFQSLEPHDFQSIIEKWNRELNTIALALNTTLNEDLSSPYNQNMIKFVEKLSHCYFYVRNAPVHRYLRDTFGGLGTLEAFGAQLFMPDHCDFDVRIICDGKKAEEDVIQSVLTEILRRNPDEKYDIKKRPLTTDAGDTYPVISIKFQSLDISLFPNGFFESNHYIPHAAASLNLKNGRLRCDHHLFRNILEGRVEVGEKVSPYANLLSREVHILKFLIRACFVPASYLGRLSQLRFGQKAQYIIDTLNDYKGDLLGLDQKNRLLKRALSTLISRHFNEDYLTPAFLHRSINLIRFCTMLGFNLVASKNYQQFELGLDGLESLQVIRLKLIRDGVKIDRNRTLFFVLNPRLEPYFLPAPHPLSMFGLFGAPQASAAATHDQAGLGAPRAFP